MQNKKEIQYAEWIKSSLGDNLIKNIMWSKWIENRENNNIKKTSFFKEMELNIEFENKEVIRIYSCNLSNLHDQSGHYVIITGQSEEALKLDSNTLCDYLSILRNNFIFIDETRTIDTCIAKILGKNLGNENLAGLNFADELMKEATQLEADWDKFKKYINDGFKDIINEKFELERVSKKGFNPAHHLLVNYDNLPVKLKDLGSGISQILMFLTFFYRYSNRKDIYVFIDEPESNIHPETLIKLFRFCTNQLSRQYFLLTHSSVLIDQTDFVD
ncbi:AAA family ATPase [Bacillus cereus group sp. Bc253]|uniref:AAA family ATPase n=1 Tax=Bacillus cereus group sp. Bc253 TaxID=3018103 RepID=UPI0022E595E4|nr:AAA family ATPase [Bacillus cereus group sp. Bc253]MDA2157940.1 AAA family ATPase [Bacillus cereus group sp. Bc253]